MVGRLVEAQISNYVKTCEYRITDLPTCWHFYTIERHDDIPDMLADYVLGGTTAKAKFKNKSKYN